MNILVTGGAGFIGSAVCRHLIGQGRGKVVNYDVLTYAGNLTSLASIDQHPNYVFVKGDILDRDLFLQTLLEHQIDAVMHLAAESHVDRSIMGPEKFAETNVMGTVRVLGAVLEYWNALEGEKKSGFRFHHISTDEVFGDLPFDDSLFSETTPYDPSSPYSASKAASDHFVRAWHHTYGLPVVLTNCSNNYGPYHFPEKLIPLTIINALNLKNIPVYGDGKNVRDWLYVDDHAVALESVLLKGKIGESYNIGGRAEKTNLQVVNSICEILDRVKPRADGQSYSKLITFVTDRLGHDRRYAIDPSKTEKDIKWLPAETFETGLEKTVSWYINNPDWWEPLLKAAEIKQI